MKRRTLSFTLAVVACIAAIGCRPDLQVSLTAKDSYQEGEEIGPTVDVTVSNTGSAAAPGTNDAPDDGYMVDLVLSSDATAPVAFAVVPDPYAFQEDMLLTAGRISNTDTVAAGGSKVYAGHGGAIPPGAPATARLCAVVDPGTKVAESDESNNVSCVTIGIVAAPVARCVTFEPPALGTQYGAPMNMPGDWVLAENGIDVTVESFRWPTGGTFNRATIEGSTADFGVNSKFAWMNNINFEFDFSGLGFVASSVTFEFEDLGGFENLSVNGVPSPVWVGELPTAPIATSPPVPIPGGYKSVATVAGPGTTLRVGGQEFGIDMVCAWP